MKNLKPLLFVLSIFLFASCETEQEIFDQDQEINVKTQQNYQSKASIYIRRNKLKQKNGLGYRATFNVDNSSEQIKSFAFLLEGSGGPLETVLKPSGKKDAKGLEIYKWKIEEENLFKVGEEIQVIATPLNEDGKEIGEPQVLTMTVEGSKQESAFAYIRRGKIQKRKVGSAYKATFFVNNSSEQTTNFAVLLEGSRGSLETVIKPSGKKNAKGYDIYNWDFDGDGIFEKGEEVKVIATPLNEDGKEISEPQVLYLKIENKIIVSPKIIKKPTLKLNKDRKTFSLNVSLKRKKLNDEYKNLKVNVILKATNGDNNGEGSSFGFAEITRGLVVYTDNNVNFSNSSSVIGEKFIAQVSLSNEKGEELDYAEFRIVGLE